MVGLAALAGWGGLGQKPGVLPQARTERFDGAEIGLFVDTSVTAPMAMRSAMTAIMVRRCNDGTWLSFGVSLASGAAKAIIMASIFSGTACRSFPINSSLMLLLACSQTTPRGGQPTDVETLAGYLS